MERKHQPEDSGTFEIPGFVTGATCAGLKVNGKPDVGIIVSERPCVAAGVFTRNRVVGEPIKVSRRHLRGQTHRAIVVNSKYANVCTGKQGYQNALSMARKTANLLGCDIQEVLVSSTGVIGEPTPMGVLLPGIEKAWSLRHCSGWTDTAQAIMTTDTHAKMASARCKIGKKTVHIGGIAKGSGMIHPNMATMLAFIATDVSIDKDLLQDMLKRVVDRSFNCVTVDGDTSTSDMAIVLANGAAGNRRITRSGPQADAFEKVLEDICINLARQIAADGEGARHLMTVHVTGARSDKAARQVAHTVATSPLVKTAVAGEDANVGRIAAAVGRAGVPLRQEELSLAMNGFLFFADGEPIDFDEPALTHSLGDEEIIIDISIGSGAGEATVWSCDLTHDYISINADYRT